MFRSLRQRRPRHGTIPVSAPSRPDDDSYWPHLRAQVVNRDHVDESALSTIENQADADETSDAYFVAGEFEAEHGNPEGACRYFERALSLKPNQSYLLAWYTTSLTEVRRSRRPLPKPSISPSSNRIRHKLFAGWRLRI